MARQGYFTRSLESKITAKQAKHTVHAQFPNQRPCAHGSSSKSHDLQGEPRKVGTRQSRGASRIYS